MKRFRILHPLNGELNIMLIRNRYEYEEICVLEANNLEDAFMLSQNGYDDSDEYTALGRRSTSVGDIITDLDGDDVMGNHYFVAPVGFEEIPFVVTQYLDWKNYTDIEEDAIL